jgi:hypothetical protein
VYDGQYFGTVFANSRALSFILLFARLLFQTLVVEVGYWLEMGFEPMCLGLSLVRFVDAHGSGSVRSFLLVGFVLFGLFPVRVRISSVV